MPWIVVSGFRCKGVTCLYCKTNFYGLILNKILFLQRPPVAIPETPVNDGYSLVARETPTDDGYEGDGYVGDGDSGYDYDYQEPFFEPANEEEELIVQLNTKLAVTTIPRQDLESVLYQLNLVIL